MMTTTERIVYWAEMLNRAHSRITAGVHPQLNRHLCSIARARLWELLKVCTEDG